MHTDMRLLLPRTRGEALSARAGNFALTMNHRMAFNATPVSAGAAWRHYVGDCTTRFAWEDKEVYGPRATVMYIRNGPSFFASKWRILFVSEVVAKSRLFASLPDALLRVIATLAV